MVDVLPGAETMLRPGQKIYIAMQKDVDEEIVRQLMENLQVPQVAAQARYQSDYTPHGQLLSLGHVNVVVDSIKFTTVRPEFDFFQFPHQCVGMALGPGGLDLRNNFGIPLAALVGRNDDVRKWWPDLNDVIEAGDGGLVMRDIFTTEEDRRARALSIDKLQALQDHFGCTLR